MPPIRSGFVPTAGGLKVYWQAIGSGPKTLICCNGVGVSTFFWKYVVRDFADDYQVILWDYRGHGRSDRPLHPDAADLSIRGSATDLGLIQDAVGAEHAVLLGHSMGCQVILERAIQAPDRTVGLVPMLGSAGKVLDTFYDTPRSKTVFKTVYRMSEVFGDRVNRFAQPLVRGPLAWPFALRTRMVDPLYTQREDFQPYLDHLADLDLRLFMRMVLEAHDHDAFPHLQDIQTRTLVIAAERDDFTPLWLSEKMARDLPDSDLMVLADASHAALIEQPHTINHRLKRFLESEVPWS